MTLSPTGMLARPRGLAVLTAPFALAAALLLMLLTAAPASAHDTLVSSDPGDGSTLAPSPEKVTLSYSADVLDVSPVIQIAEAGGDVVAEPTPEVDGSEVTGAIDEPLPAGDYEVRWRVVSSDGHPIEGTQTFTVEQGPAQDEASDAGGKTSTPAAASDAGGATAAPVTSAPAASTDEGGGFPVVLVVVIVVALIAVGGGAVAALRRRG